MKSLKLKKVKISKIGNPHILFGGQDAYNAGAATQNPDYPDTYPCDGTKDTKHEGDCPSQTNNTTTLGNATEGIYDRQRVSGLDTGN